MPHSPRLFPFLEAAFEDGVHAQLLVDVKRTLVRANRQARELLSIVPSEVGRPLRDPDISFHSVELWGSIEEAFRRHRPVRLANVECPRSYGVLLQVQTSPILRHRRLLGASLTFTEELSGPAVRRRARAGNAGAGERL